MSDSPHSDHDVRPLARILSQWETRLRLQHSLDWLPRGLAVGLFVAILLAVSARLWPILPQSTLTILSIVLGLLGGVVALLIVWLWRRSPLELAQRFDQAFGLKERMSTAVEIAEGQLSIRSAELATRQHDQALREAARVEPREHIPLRATWWEWLIPLALIGAMVAALYLPNPQDNVLAERRSIQQAIAQELEELRDLREEALENEELTADEQAAIVEALDHAIETLEQRGVTQEEALAALEATEEQLRDLSEEFAEAQQEALQAASDALEGTAADEAAEALQEGNDAEAASQSVEDMDVEGLSDEEQQELAEGLESAAESLEGTNSEAAEAMREAAEALRNGDAQAAEEALDQAAEAMRGEGNSGEGTAEEYAERIRKDQEQIAGAGENSVPQPGQGEMGQAQPGSGQSDESGQPGGQSHGAGRGESQGAEQGGAEQAPDSFDNQAGDGGERPFDEIYSPQRVGGEGGDQVDIPGNPGTGLPTGAEGEFSENPSGDSTVPYDTVFEDYEGSVNEAMESGYVPLGLRDLIRDYFTRLDPTSD